MSPAADELVTVRLLGFPVQVHARARQQAEAMRREFTFILRQERDQPGSVPSRLLALSEILGKRYEGFTEAQEQQIEQALEQGTVLLDELVFVLPRHAGDAAVTLGGVLDEADDWCRTGQLLVFASSPDIVAYRQWYLSNIAEQCAGGRARPWTGPQS